MHAMWIDLECHGAAWKHIYSAIAPPQIHNKVQRLSSLQCGQHGRVWPPCTVPCVQQALVTRTLLHGVSSAAARASMRCSASTFAD